MYKMSIAGCGNCVCRTCLKWWSNRCPHGECFDDWRAAYEPYDAAHPNDPPRTGWSNWKTDQAYWCRGGVCYPQERCEHYIQYDKTATKVKSCLCGNVTIFQDGYIQCSLIDSVGCEDCYKRLADKLQKGE